MASNFQRMDDFTEVKDYAVELKETGVHTDSKANPPAPQYDDDHPPPFSWNPMDWYRDIKHEISNFGWELNERNRVLLRAILGEGLVTFLFLFIVEAVVINNGRQQNPENLVLGCVATAFCSVALIYSFADVSGAHFNPAVTFATMVTGKVSIRKGLGYIGVQLISSILATLALFIVFPKPTTGSIKSIPLAVVVNIDSTAYLVNAVFMEIMLTYILVYVIFAVAFDTVDTSNEVKVEDGAKADKSVGRYLTIYTTSGNTKAGFAPVAIGFTLGFLGLLGGSVSGGAYNPARAFGPALITGVWDNHWVYWVGDLVGAALAGWTQSFFAHKAVQHSAATSTKKAKA